MCVVGSNLSRVILFALLPLKDQDSAPHPQESVWLKVVKKVNVKLIHHIHIAIELIMLLSD